METNDLALSLTHSAIIHSHMLATSIQFAIQREYGLPIPPSLRDWAYYQNMRGVKRVNQNKVMVTIPSTNTTTELTLETYDVTLRSVLEQRGSLYTNLLKSYPNDVSYILGVMQPIDALTLTGEPIYREGEIVYYNTNLLAYNEDNVIPKVQELLYNNIKRWVNPKYMITDPKYADVLMIQLRMLLFYKLNNVRYSNIDTANVSDSELLSRLGDYGLREYVSVLDKKSKLWLYKNIVYITHNIGKDSIINLLIDKLLKPSGYTVSEVIVKTGLPLYDSDLNNPVNEYDDNLMILKDRVTKDETSIDLNIIRKLQLNNPDLVEGESTIRYQVGTDSELRSKLLVISNDVITLTNIFKLEYAYIDITNKLLTGTGKTYNISIDIGKSGRAYDIEKVKQLFNYCIRKLSNQSVDVDIYTITQSALYDNIATLELHERYDSVLDGELSEIIDLPVVPLTEDTVSDYINCIKDIDLNTYGISVSHYNALIAADAEIINDIMHSHTTEEMSLDMTLEEYIEGNFVLSNTSNVGLQYILNNIITAVTGISTEDIDNSDMGKLKSLMETLSSYTVRYSVDILNPDNIIARKGLNVISGLNFVTLEKFNYDCRGTICNIDALLMQSVVTINVLNNVPITVTHLPTLEVTATSIPLEGITQYNPNITITF